VVALSLVDPRGREPERRDVVADRLQVLGVAVEPRLVPAERAVARVVADEFQQAMEGLVGGTERQEVAVGQRPDELRALVREVRLVEDDELGGLLVGKPLERPVIYRVARRQVVEVAAALGGFERVVGGRLDPVAGGGLDLVDRPVGGLGEQPNPGGAPSVAGGDDGPFVLEIPPKVPDAAPPPVREQDLRVAGEAVDVVPHRARRDTAFLGVDGADAADREAVALVAVGHAERVAGDARQVGGVSQLLEGHVVADLL
jgi:hypothetical protein